MFNSGNVFVKETHAAVIRRRMRRLRFVEIGSRDCGAAYSRGLTTAQPERERRSAARRNAAARARARRGKAE